MHKDNAPKISIVGGGILGLTLAYLLAKKKYTVSIIEKGPELGGLASGFKIEGTYLERYYHHFFKSDVSLQDLLKELGLAEKIMWLPSKMAIYDGNGIYSFSHALDILKFPRLSFFNRLRLGLISFLLQKMWNVEKFKGITAYEWCKKYFGAKVTAAIWEPLLKSKFEGFYDKVAMEWLYIRIHDRASSRDNPIKDEKLGYIKGSFQILIDTLEDRLKELGVTIYKQADIINYEEKQGNHILEFTSKSGKRKISSKLIVSTIPPQAFIRIFKPNKNYKDKLNSIDFLAAYCFVLKIKKPLTKFYWTSVNDPQAPFVAMVEHTNLLPREDFNDHSILYLGKYIPRDSELYKLSEKELYKKCFNYLKRIVPDIKSADILESHFFRANEAQHIVTTDYKVLSYESGRKGLIFAHFAQIYPHDRGTNYAIAQAYDLFNLISSKKWN